jgi:hypothetical protein
VVIAGPAFGSGRYGLACAEVCKLARTMQIPAVTGMHPDNPGAQEMAGIVIVPTGETSADMAKALAAMTRLALKLGRGDELGPAEVEGALIDHDAVNAAAVIGAEDETTGTAVVAYVILEPGVEPDDDLRNELFEQVGEELGKPFRPRELRFVDAFPKTQSGKIIRRAIEAAHLGEDPGDLSSMENPEALEAIEAAR